MGYTEEIGPEGAPEFNSTPQTVADLERLRDLVVERGNVFKDTTAVRTSFTSDGFAQEGHLWYDTTLNAYLRYDGATWVQIWPQVLTGSGALVGTAPTVATPLIEKTGVTGLVATNASGDTSIVYPAVFPNGVLSAQLTRFDYSVLGATFEILAASQTVSQLNFRVFSSAGAALVSTPNLKYVYRVIGW